MIPIFGFPELGVGPDQRGAGLSLRFGRDFELAKAADGRNILGMVGTGAMNRIMILVKPDLIQGFKNAGDKRNVGVHEFAHLVDKSDGVIDGIPGCGPGPARRSARGSSWSAARCRRSTTAIPTSTATP